MPDPEDDGRLVLARAVHVLMTNDREARFVKRVVFDVLAQYAESVTDCRLPAGDCGCPRFGLGQSGGVGRARYFDDRRMRHILTDPVAALSQRLALAVDAANLGLFAIGEQVVMNA